MHTVAERKIFAIDKLLETSNKNIGSDLRIFFNRL